jgi:hypothetical protein
MSRKNRYTQLIESVFFQHYRSGDQQVSFERRDIERAAAQLDIRLPKNLGDVVYSFRYRADLPESITSLARTGLDWVILPTGRAHYTFVTTALAIIEPTAGLIEVKIPDATPSIISRYALGDEQALLAKLRYNRLIDIFTRVTCYSLQSHLRTTVPDVGQVETDELYIGVDKRGAHYVFPVQAKGGNDRLSIVQIFQDKLLCTHKLPGLICYPIAAQFIAPDLIALFMFDGDGLDMGILAETHYRLVQNDQLSDAEISRYRYTLPE